MVFRFFNSSFWPVSDKISKWPDHCYVSQFVFFSLSPHDGFSSPTDDTEPLEIASTSQIGRIICVSQLIFIALEKHWVIFFETRSSQTLAGPNGGRWNYFIHPVNPQKFHKPGLPWSVIFGQKIQTLFLKYYLETVWYVCWKNEK